MVEAIGWLSSAILVVTIAQQIYKQRNEGTSKGVSKWLFVGQIAASIGFTIYSLLIHSWVFSITNGLMVLNGLIGYGITVRHRRRGR